MDQAKLDHIIKVRADNESQYGKAARQTVQRLLEPMLPFPWMYVYELTQNARDAGAKSVSWQVDGDAVLFQHDGHIPLNEEHVRALAALGGSTKGIASVGFMGVGFKSVFSCYRTARVSGSGWRFRFDVEISRGELGVEVPDWMGTLLPRVDHEPLEVSEGYTTAFRLERPAKGDHNPLADLHRLIAEDDLTPLAVMALRGLTDLDINGRGWELSVNDETVSVVSPASGVSRHWMAFRAQYRPDDLAIRRFLEVRQLLQEDRPAGERQNREVVALLPIESDGRPAPPKRGTVYATLPTQVQVPLGFHLQADWLVNIDRQNIRDIEGDPWQSAIVNQVPHLVAQLMTWLSELPAELSSVGYQAMRVPESNDGPLATPLLGLRQALADALRGKPLLPVYSGRGEAVCTPESAFSLPSALDELLGGKPHWHPGLLFSQPILDRPHVGETASHFIKWLGFAPEIRLADTAWPSGLDHWWSTLHSDERASAIFALWEGVRRIGWNDAPVVPTESGTWARPAGAIWLNERPPHHGEPDGEVIADLLKAYLPPPDRRLRDDLRSLVEKDASNEVSKWLKQLACAVSLSELVEKACSSHASPPLVSLLKWALSRGPNRCDLLPLVLTEAGPRRPEVSLMANPLVPNGECRRRLFPALPALENAYYSLPNRLAARLFLERCGVAGKLDLKQGSEKFESKDKRRVAESLQMNIRSIPRSDNYGYEVVDWKLPVDVATADVDALRDWLSDGCEALQEKGRKRARCHYYGEFYEFPGTALSTWLQQLVDCPWIRCEDGITRRPTDLLLAPDPEYEDAPIARLDARLARVLSAEGMRFGSELKRASSLTRFSRLTRGPRPPTDRLAALLAEIRRQIGSNETSRQEFLPTLASAYLFESITFEQLARRTGGGKGLRGNLGGYVVEWEELPDSLKFELTAFGIEIPQTTTGSQALKYLRRTWREPAERVKGEHVAMALRYLLEDLERSDSLRAEWEESRHEARVYGEGRWHEVNDHLVVDDVESPLIKGMIPTDRTVISASHLSENAAQLGGVSRLLGLKRLSEDIQVETGPVRSEPVLASRFERILHQLARLDDREPLSGVRFVERLQLVIGDSKHNVRAYVHGAVIFLKGNPPDYTKHAVDQLVVHFKLRQRGEVVVYLASVIQSLTDPNRFETELRELIHALGLAESLEAQSAAVAYAESSSFESVSASSHSTESSTGETTSGRVVRSNQTESQTQLSPASPQQETTGREPRWIPEEIVASKSEDEERPIVHSRVDEAPSVSHREVSAANKHSVSSLHFSDGSKERPTSDPSHPDSIVVPQSPTFEIGAILHDHESSLNSGSTGRFDSIDLQFEVDLNHGKSSTARTFSSPSPIKRPRRLISYIGVENASRGEPDPEGLSPDERMAVEEQAIQLILSQEPQLQRTPEGNPGYDLFERDEKGNILKYVEVKSMRGSIDSHPATLSHVQFELALKEGRKYSLYIVEGVGGSNPRVLRIQNPAGRDSRFTFDAGWRNVPPEA